MYKVHLEYDQDVGSPNDNYGWKLISFNPKFSSYQDPDTLGFLIRDKIKTGHAHLLSYYEHGNHWWGLANKQPPPGVEFQWDGVRIGGLLLWDEKEDPPGIESAEDFLKEYTDWSNGHCYAYAIYDEDGNCVDSCGGFIGDDYMLEQIAEVVRGKECEYVGVASHIAE